MPSKTAAKLEHPASPAPVISFPGTPLSVHSLPALELAHQRAIAIAAGDLQVMVKREVLRLLEEHKGNPMGAVKVGLERLLSDGAITATEFNTLSEVSEVVLAADRGKVDPNVAYQKAQSAYHRVLLDNAASPLALAILSVLTSAYASVPAEAGGPASDAVFAAKASQGGDIGLVGGALIGGIIGGSLGGVGGAIIGGVIGGIVGGVVGVCASKS